MSELDQRVTDPRFIDAIDRVMKELQKRRAVNDRCQRCNANNWNADLIRVIASPEMSGFGYPPPFIASSSPSYIPTLALSCKNCGNMVLHNLHVLNIPL
jgi:hypothetical protein